MQNPTLQSKVFNALKRKVYFKQSLNNLYNYIHIRVNAKLETTFKLCLVFRTFFCFLRRFLSKLSRCNCINLANISGFTNQIVFFPPPNLHLWGRETNKYKWYRYTNWCHYFFTTSRILLRNAFKNSFTAGAGREVLGGRRSGAI